MPLNPGKILSIILDECKSIEDRYDGYQEHFIDDIIDIIDYERKNLVQGTNIQQQINEKCNSAGDLLARMRSQTEVPQEVDS